MARPEKYTNEQIIKFVDLYRLDNPNKKKIKFTEIAEYMTKNGCPIEAYLLNRPTYKESKEYIEKLNKQTEEDSITTIFAFKELDINHVLSIKDKKKFSEFLINRDKYYIRVCNAAIYFKGEYDKAKSYSKQLSNELSSIKEELEALKDYKELQARIKNLEKNIQDFVIPEFANKLLAEDNLVKLKQDVVKKIPTIKAEDIKNKSIQDLLGDLND